MVAERRLEENYSRGSVLTISGDCLSVIRIKINDKYTTALLDSGASISAMGIGMVKKLNLYIKPPTADCPEALYTANGRVMRNQGTVVAELDIGGRRLKQNFMVLNGLTANIICGCDFLRNHKAVVDMAGGTVVFNKAITIPLIRRREYLGVARLLTKTIIPPLSERAVLVKVKRNHYKGQINLLDLTEPIHGLKVSTKTCQSWEIMSIQLCNETNRSLHLKKWGPVASCIRKLDTFCHFR
jgi:hypothetical protein